MNRANAKWALIAAKHRYKERCEAMKKEILEGHASMSRMLSQAILLEDEDYTGQKAN